MTWMFIPCHPVIPVVHTMEAIYGCLVVSQVHVDGEETEAERSLLLCNHLRGWRWWESEQSDPVHMMGAGGGIGEGSKGNEKKWPSNDIPRSYIVGGRREGGDRRQFSS